LRLYFLFTKVKLSNIPIAVSQRFLFRQAIIFVDFSANQESAMPRLFIAIDIPGPIKEALTQFTRELPAARWVPADQIHLTLRFIGEAGPQAFAAIKGALAGIQFHPFQLGLHGAGHFPPGKHPRVLWVGVEANPELMELYQDLELALVDVGIPPEERPFSPHLTLARLKTSAPAAVGSFETRHGELAFAPFEVREVILYSSVLANDGAIHSREAVVACRE
jgi:RNA 2',3'-cyclic 3'-phosphodiesterase